MLDDDDKIGNGQVVMGMVHMGNLYSAAGE